MRIIKSRTLADTLREAGASMEDEGYLIVFKPKHCCWEVGDYTDGVEELQAGAISFPKRTVAERLCDALTDEGVHLVTVVRAFAEMVCAEGGTEAPLKEEPYKREVAITSKEDGCILAHLRVDFNEKTFESGFDEDVVDVTYAERFKFKPVAVDE